MTNREYVLIHFVNMIAPMLTGLNLHSANVLLKEFGLKIYKHHSDFSDKTKICEENSVKINNDYDASVD